VSGLVPPTEWPLVGRTHELGRVAEILDAGTASGVLLAGPAGVGKTRLAFEAVEIARERGFPTASVRANRSAATIPYGAFAPLLPTTDRPRESRADVLREATEAVLALAGDGRLVLFVDDAHELDEASAALLLQLALSDRTFLVVTMRSDQPAPDPVVLLWKDEILGRIDLQPLGAKDTARLIAGALGGAVEGTTVQGLWSASGGNALFLRELIVAGTESGRLEEQHGIWRLHGPPSPSPRLVELVELRLGALDDDERAGLEVVSVGEPLGFAELDLLSERAVVDRLERRGLVEVMAEGHRRQVRMAHPLYGEVVRSSLPSGRRETVCRGLADAFEGAGARRREDALRVALWRLEGGGGGHDAELLLDAAEQANYRFEFALTKTLAQAAWDAGGGAEAGHLLGETLDSLGDHEGAEEILRAAESRVTTEFEGAMVAKARSSNLFRGLNRIEEAEAVALSAERTLTDDDLRQEMVGHRATNALLSGDLELAVELAGPLLERADDRAFAQGALAAAPALALMGRTTKAIEVADRAFAARLALGDQVQMAGPGVYLTARALALTEAGRLLEAEGTAQAGYDGAVEQQIPEGQGWFTVLLGLVCARQGRPQTAARWHREAAVIWDDLNHPAARWGFGGLAMALALVGDIDGAESALSDLDAEPATVMRMMDVEIDRGRAWVAWVRGEHGRALSLLRATADDALERSHLVHAVGALHDIARLGEPDEALVEELAALAERVDGELTPVRVAHVAAMVKGDAEALDDVSNAFEALGAILFAAEAATASAVLHGRAGLKRKASAAAQRAATLAERCEGARTPGLAVGERADAVALTRREREVAVLAARGMASREIAGTLVVSTRTVENHLQRAYEKLGVRGRPELAEALGPDDADAG